MLESLAATLLNRVLGSYVENFDPAQLNVGIWSGNVELQDLKLRGDCLDSLELPLEVENGVLGSLVLSVPWSNLKNKPVKIIINDCYLLVKPSLFSYNESEEAERELKLKLKKLMQWELNNQARQAVSGAGDDALSAQNESFMQSLITKIVDNLQVIIKNIHIRYEDTTCVFSKTPAAIGFTLAELSAVSTNENWEPSFIEIRQSLTHKLLTLDSLGVYWDTDAREVFCAEEDDDVTQFKDKFSNLKNPEQYLLKPVSGTGKLSINKLGTTETQSHVSLQLACKEFGIELDDKQYADLLTTISNTHFQKQTEKFKTQRPTFTPGENPRSWFQYIAKCVFHEVKQKNKMWTWDRIKTVCSSRREYVRLWIEKLKLPNLEEKLPNKDDETRLQQLHELLSYETIIIFRMLAKRESARMKLSSEGTSTKKDTASVTKGSQSKAASTHKGWLSSWWNSGKDTPTVQDTELVMTKEQRQELYDAIEFNEFEMDKGIVDSQVPNHYITWHLVGVLEKGYLGLKKDNQKLAQVIFQHCELDFCKRPNSYLASFNLNQFNVEDQTAKSLYKHIVSPKAVDGATSDRLFNIEYESNPLSNIADARLDLKLLGTTVFYHVYFLAEVMKFFQPKQQHMDTIGAIISAAGATVDGWTTQTRMGIESLLEDHKTLALNLDLQAPLIILPVDPRIWDSPCIVIDAGHISMISDVVPKEKINSIKQLSVQEYDSIDDNEINRLMFDRYHITSQDTQILVGTSVESTLSSLADNDTFCVLNKMQLDITLDLSILPKAHKLPKIKISGHLPKLTLAYNDYQYKIIMDFIAHCVPELDDFGIVAQHSNVSDDVMDQKIDQARLAETLKLMGNVSELELLQKKLNVTFEVDEIKFSMLKCIDTQSMECKKLADLAGTRFRFNFVKTLKGMDLDISAHSLDVEDYIENSSVSEFKKLISSDVEGHGEEDDLFSLQYNRTQRIVTHNSTYIELFDQNLDINMTKLKLVITPKSILTLLNYSVFTFTTPQVEELPADALKHNVEGKDDSPQKLNLNINMEGLFIILNDEGTKLATLDLSAGKLRILLLPESMKVDMTLDGLDLTDEVIQNRSRCSPVRKLISMDGDQLIELQYESFDSETNQRNYDSLFKCVTGSMFVNFNDAAINRILKFVYKFQKMKSYFDAVRQAAYSQVPTIETVKNMKLDVLIKSPIVQFPKERDVKLNLSDVIKFYLGELFIQNEFITDSNGSKLNRINAGLRDGQISSSLYLENGLTQELSLAEGMSVVFDIMHNTQKTDLNSAEFDVDGRVEELSLNVTELQLQYLYQIVDKVSRTFTVDDVEPVQISPQDLDLDINSPTPIKMPSESISNTPSDKVPPESGAKSCHLNLSSPGISLTLYDNTSQVTSIEESSITRVTFQDMACVYDVQSDGTSSGEAYIAAFKLEDTRETKDSKYTELIPKMSKEGNQFSAVLSRKWIESGLLTNLSVTINSPRFILAMDHMMALKRFFDIISAPKTSLETAENTKINPAPMVEMREEHTYRLFQYSLNVVDSAFLLLADPSDINTEAVVFSVGQFLFTEQNITTLSANNIGMFLSKMNTTEEHVIRLLDDFSTSVTIDKRNSTKERLLTDIRVSLEPIIMRISLRDIRLAMLIFNHAVSLWNEYNKSLGPGDEDDQKPKRPAMFSKEFERKLMKYAPTLNTIESVESDQISAYANDPDIRLKGETLTADFGGFRMILLGDVHEMPILDTNINSFTLGAKDWSTELDGMTTMETSVNIFNYSRSSWEPLIEPTNISFHLSKGWNANSTIVLDAITREVTEITLSSRSIAALSNIPGSLNSELRLTPRGSKKPYMLVNDVGFDLLVWIKTEDEEERKNLTTLKNGESLPWEFEDWMSIRQRLGTDNKKSILNVAVANEAYSTVLTIDATGEGEDLYVLKPAVNHVHRRVVCDLKCSEDNVKVITFRSTLLLENATCTRLQIKVDSPECTSPTFLTIEPSSSHSIPVEYAYSCKLFFRPSIEPDYGWSEEGVSWTELLTKPVSLECVSGSSSLRKFYLELNGKYDSNEPLAKIFPHMKIIISPSLIIENMLPFDMNYSIVSKRADMKNFSLLKKADKVSVHSVSLDEFLLLSVQPHIEGCDKSKPSIVNTPKKTSLQPENILAVDIGNGQRLTLMIKYQSIEGSRAKVLKIYSPYIILNGTDRDLYIEGANFNVAHSKVLIQEKDETKKYTQPLMFSFNSSHSSSNRARIKFKDTDWSVPLSFDAIGQSFDGTLNDLNKSRESNVGINISEGLGKYYLSKIINIKPRYMVQNDLDFAIDICELGSSDNIRLGPGSMLPLYNLRNVLNKQLMIKTLGFDAEWSAPFFMKDIGLTYLKLLTEEGTHMLLKLEIVLQEATVFVKVTSGDEIWPYSIRNFSDYEFIFYQRDVKLVDEHYDDSNASDALKEVEFKPLYYRVPPRSVMPYAWDYPTARQKKLILTSGGRKREIQLAEIGNLKPMRIPSSSMDADGKPSVVDLNVVADGPTQALMITNYDPQLSLYKLKKKGGSVNMRSSASLQTTMDAFETEEANSEDEKLFTKVVVSFKGLGISLITADLKEIMYVNVGGIEVRYNDSELYKTVSWKVKWFQIDNQLYDALYQNILYPATIPNTTKDLENHPVVSGSVSRVKDDSYGVPYFKHLTFLLQEFAIQLDEQFIYALINYLKFPGASWNNKDAGDSSICDTVTLPHIKEVSFANDVYFEVFHLQPTLLHLSFMRSDQIDAESKIETPEITNALTSMFFLNVLTMTVGNVNDAPIKLNSLLLDNVRVPMPLLYENIKTHYAQQFFYQIHMILGSADFLGNPVGLFNTISSGVWDLFYEPYQGYMLNDRPQEIGIHIAKGGLSFAKKTVFGISDSMAKLTGSVAKGLSVTQDAQFQEARRLQQRKARAGGGGGAAVAPGAGSLGPANGVFGNTATSFVNTIGSGLSGLALDPIRGSRQEGTAGFFKGVGRGIVGLPLKTAIGILDLTNNISQGVKSTATGTGPGGGPVGGVGNGRARLPRFVDPHEQIIVPYDLRAAQGQYWLKTSSGGLYLGDHYLAHTVLPGAELCVVISLERIAEVNIAQQDVVWGVAYPAVQAITAEDGGLRLRLKTQSEYFIPVSDPRERRALYGHVRVAVLRFNRLCEAVL